MPQGVQARLILGCTVPVGPLERLRRAEAPATAQQGWRTSHFRGPTSPHPERWAVKGPQSHGRVCFPLPPALGLVILPSGGSRAPALRCFHMALACAMGTPSSATLDAWSASRWPLRPSPPLHLQDGAIQSQQHLPGLLANAGQAVGQRAAEQQVAEPSAAEGPRVRAQPEAPPRPRPGPAPAEG